MLNSEMKVGIVVSEFNQDITSKLLLGALSRFAEQGVKEENLNIVKVPGAIEIPLVAKLFARSQKYHAIVCLGAVIRGETTHYDYVCQQVSTGCQQVMMEYNLPVIFGVLTTENEEQALARTGGAEGNKGADAADAALAMAKVVKTISA